MVAPPPNGAAYPRAVAPPRAGAGSTLLRVYPSLESSAFRLIWLGTLQSMVAWQMSVVASGYAALVISGSATTLGLVSAAAGLPLLLSPIGGVAADRYSRRTLLLLSQSTMGLGAVVLAALALVGQLQVWHLVGLAGVQGVAFAFNAPARQAYMGNVVPIKLMRNAVALNNAGMNFCRVGGPALAGGLLAVPGVGIAGVFAVMSVLYLGVLWTFLRLPADRAEAAGRRSGGLEQLLEGLRYVTSSAVLMALLGMALVVVFLALPYQQLLPLLSERVFQVGPAGLGALTAASGTGALVGSLIIAALSDTGRPALLQLVLGVGVGLSLVLVAVSPSFPIALLCLVAAGFTSAAYSSLNSTLIMGNSEPRMYGRVMSVYVLTWALMPMGTLPMSLLAEQAGGRVTFATAGALTAAAILAVALLYPSYRRIR